MRQLLLSASALILLGCLSAHGEEPQKSNTTEPQVDSQSAPASQSPKSDSAPASTSEAAQADVKQLEAEAKIKKYGFGGFKPEIHNGNTVYCRKETVTGSRFEQKTCRSLEQLLAQERQGQEYGNTLIQQGAGVQTNPIDAISKR